MKKGAISNKGGREYKRFARYIVGYICLFLLANGIVWKCGTEVLLTKKYGGGDLARMGYLRCMKEHQKKSDDLPVRHLEMKDFIGQPVDVLTIGDSFSNGGGEGRNSFYQDYLASINNFTVLNVYPYLSDDLIMGFAPITTLSILYNSGYLDLIRPKYVLIQSVERYCISRFAPPFSFTQSAGREDIAKYYANHGFDPNYLPKVSFINEGNFKFLYYNFLYLFSDNAFRRLVYKERLTQPLFSVSDRRTLIFHVDDLNNMPLATPEAVGKLNDNLNRLSDILARKGIRLIFLPVVDKYNLYSDFIIDNPYPRSMFFEELRPLPHRYQLIDSKAILHEQLIKGEKDIFRADDSHWSWKASKTVFERFKFAERHTSAIR
jgi:hypothetical protein